MAPTPHRTGPHPPHPTPAEACTHRSIHCPMSPPGVTHPVMVMTGTRQEAEPTNRGLASSPAALKELCGQKPAGPSLSAAALLGNQGQASVPSVTCTGNKGGFPQVRPPQRRARLSLCQGSPGTVETALLPPDCSLEFPPQARQARQARGPEEGPCGKPAVSTPASELCRGFPHAPLRALQGCRSTRQPRSDRLICGRRTRTPREARERVCETVLRNGAPTWRSAWSSPDETQADVSAGAHGNGNETAARSHQPEGSRSDARAGTVQGPVRQRPGLR